MLYKAFTLPDSREVWDGSIPERPWVAQTRGAAPCAAGKWQGMALPHD